MSSSLKVIQETELEKKQSRLKSSFEMRYLASRRTPLLFLRSQLFANSSKMCNLSNGILGVLKVKSTL